MSLIARKLACCISENKDVDLPVKIQLCGIIHYVKV